MCMATIFAALPSSLFERGCALCDKKKVTPLTEEELQELEQIGKYLNDIDDVYFDVLKKLYRLLSKRNGEKKYDDLTNLNQSWK